MGKKKKPKDKKSGNKALLAKIVIVTAILNLIEAILDLIDHFK